jgi:hypothetical protein
MSETYPIKLEGAFNDEIFIFSHCPVCCTQFALKHSEGFSTGRYDCPYCKFAMPTAIYKHGTAWDTEQPSLAHWIAEARARYVHWTKTRSNQGVNDKAYGRGKKK